jgi:Family of unknown function (DUF5906)
MNNPFKEIMAQAQPELAEPQLRPRLLSPDEAEAVARANAELTSGTIGESPGRSNGPIIDFPSPRHVTPQGNGAELSRRTSTRAALKGGTYDPPHALAMFNSRYFLAKMKGAYLIAEISDDGSITYLPERNFELGTRNIFVRVDDGHGGKKKVYAAKFWLAHEHREEREVIFEPTAPPGIVLRGKYNQWRGYAVEPRRGTRRIRRFLRHLLEVICRRNRVKFKYLIRWLAWAVQNPDKNPGTVIVLKSAHQGTGKTTLNVWMCKIFGKHARKISNKERLFDRFNSDLETVVFVDADEMLWAGDRATADNLKSLITSETITLEVKHGPRWTVANHLHIIMTTNHDHAVQAGVQDRRYFVLDVSAHRAQDASWFDPLYDDLENGGPEELLCFLLGVNLKGWHPRQLPKTTETVEQQRFSADSISQWSQACIESDAIVIGDMHYSLGQLHPTHRLYEAYRRFCKTHPANTVIFGKALAQMFGPSSRQKVAAAASPRPRTYYVPDADTWQQALDRRLGIK